jgi:PAS domain S-box-containing protein
MQADVGEASDVRVEGSPYTPSPGELVAAFVESVEEAFHIVGADGTVLTWNAGAERIYGYTAAEVIGRPVGVGCPPERREELRSAAARAFAGERITLETVRIAKDGHRIDVEIRVTPLRDPAGKVVALGAVVRDITARLRAEAEANENRYLLEQAQAVASIGSWVSQIGRAQELLWSKESYRIYGFDPGTPVSTQRLIDHIHPEDRERVLAAVRDALAGRAPYELEHRLVRPDGEVRFVYEKAAVVRDTSGKPLRIIGVVQDVTDRRHIEDQLRQAQKMEAIGRLAGGVAHDFNNLLTVILASLSIVQGAVPPGDPISLDLEEIRKASERAATLTRQLLAFSRRQVLQPIPLDLGQIVRAMHGMLGRLLRADIELSISAATPLGNVLADPTQMEQVIMNLAVNARDAMPGGGRLAIDVANVDVEAKMACAAQGGVSPGKFVAMVVSDNGVGMAPATTARLFEPFFTTKKLGEGTGLGLATVFGIVKQSSGHIWVTSEPGEGTTVHVYLPRTDQVIEASGDAGACAAGAVTSGSETILLVDDDTAVRTVLRRILSRAGYDVLEASDAAAALAISAQFGGTIHMLLTDLVMPVMSGRNLAEQLSPLRPSMKVLFMSGYTEDMAIHDGVATAGVAFLQKPVVASAVLLRVREVLASESASHPPPARP